MYSFCHNLTALAAASYRVLVSRSPKFGFFEAAVLCVVYMFCIWVWDINCVALGRQLARHTVPMLYQNKYLKQYTKHLQKINPRYTSMYQRCTKIYRARPRPAPQGRAGRPARHLVLCVHHRTCLIECPYLFGVHACIFL